MQGENAKKSCGFDENDMKTYSCRQGLRVLIMCDAVVLTCLYVLYILYRGHSFLRSVAHAEVILESGDLKTNAYNSKTIWCILILLYR